MDECSDACNLGGATGYGNQERVAVGGPEVWSIGWTFLPGDLSEGWSENREGQGGAARGKVERMISSSKHGVKSNPLSVETGPGPSRQPWSVVPHVAIDGATGNGTDTSQGTCTIDLGNR
jgi:hypothetical protein